MPVPVLGLVLPLKVSKNLRTHTLATWFSAEGSHLHFLRKCVHCTLEVLDGLKPTWNTCHVGPLKRGP